MKRKSFERDEVSQDHERGPKSLPKSMVLDHKATFVHRTELSVARFCLLRVFTGRRLSNAMLRTLERQRCGALPHFPIPRVS